MVVRHSLRHPDCRGALPILLALFGTLGLVRALSVCRAFSLARTLCVCRARCLARTLHSLRALYRPGPFAALYSCSVSSVLHYSSRPVYLKGPHLVFVYDCKALAIIRIAILLCQRTHKFNGVPCCRAALKGNSCQFLYVENALFVNKFTLGLECGFSHSQRFVVHTWIGGIEILVGWTFRSRNLSSF